MDSLSQRGELKEREKSIKKRERDVVIARKREVKNTFSRDFNCTAL